MAEEKELRYDPAAIEPKWHERWAANSGVYAAEPPYHPTDIDPSAGPPSHSSGKPKYYVLEISPYPSGERRGRR